jgi:hypothetical protein
MTQQATWHDESTGHLWMELPTGTRCSKCGVERTPGYIPECQIRQEKCDEEDKMDDRDTTSRKTMKLTDEHVAILKHTETNNTGYFCGDSSEMQDLVRLGLMKPAGKKPFVPDPYFSLARNWRSKLFKMGQMV